jgi:methyltransferase (TIGR00027 family)
VKEAEASRTALLIAASLVLLHEDSHYRPAVPESTAEFCAGVLQTYSPRSRLFLKLARQAWFRALSRRLEQATIPGILQHYALRKKAIAQLARGALNAAITQVVVIGAGFDPLALVLSREFETARFWEIDHPATQRAKRRALARGDGKRLHLLPMDLSVESLGAAALIKAGFDPARSTLWVLEGLLMYLPEAVVASLMLELSELSSRGSRAVFTFMERQSDGRIRFRSQTQLVDWWLRTRGEPFLWGATREELARFVHPWRVVRIVDDENIRRTEPALAKEPIAVGELICAAEI